MSYEADLETLKRIAQEIQRLINADWGPGEFVHIPEPLTQGYGMAAFLDFYFLNAGWTETLRRTGIHDDPALLYYREKLDVAAVNLGITQPELEALYRRTWIEA